MGNGRLRVSVLWKVSYWARVVVAYGQKWFRTMIKAIGSAIKKATGQFDGMLAHGAKMTPCGWCGYSTPVYQPMSITGGSGTTCQFCRRTVDEYYRDWYYRAEDGDGCYIIRFVTDDGGCGVGNHASFDGDERFKIVKEWNRTKEEASKFTVPNPDYAGVLDQYSEDFRSFFLEALDAIGCNDYFGGRERSLRTRWHYEKLPGQVRELWLEGKYYEAVTVMNRELSEGQCWPLNPFINDRDRVVIDNVLRVIGKMEREESDAGYKMSNGWRQQARYAASSSLRKAMDEISDWLYLKSSYYPHGEPENDRLPDDKLMVFVNKYRNGCPAEDFVSDLPELKIGDWESVNEMHAHGEGPNFYFDVYIKWPYSDVVEKQSVTNSFWVDDPFCTYEFDGETIHLGKSVKLKEGTRVWLIGQGLEP